MPIQDGRGKQTGSCRAFTPDPDFFLKKFEHVMSDNMRLFLKLELVEVRQHFAHDAGLMITWDELADRIENWD